MAEIARQDLKAPPGGEVTLGLDEAKAWKANVSEIALRLVEHQRALESVA